MARTKRSALLAVTVSAVVLGSCASSHPTHPLTGLDESLRPAPKPYSHKDAARQKNGQVGDTTPRDGKFKGVEDAGTGEFTSPRAFSDTVRAERTTRGGDGITLNLVNVPIAQAAKSVLGEILKVNYTISDKIAGSITIQTSTPMSREGLVDVFESALKINGAALVRSEGHYKILPAQGAVQSGARLTTGSRRDASAGLQIQVVTPNYISPSEMRRILEPVAPQGAILNVDDARNLIVVAGTQRELADIAQLVQLFDVDWMKGMSVGIYPSNASDPEALAREVEAVMGLDKDGPLKGSVRIIPNRRLAAVMVIASRPAHLDTARKWLHNLDKAAARTEDQLFVYKVKNRVASELASVLTRMISGRDTGGTAQTPSGVGPRLDPVTTSSISPNEQPPSNSARASSIASGSAATAAAAGAAPASSGPGNLLFQPPSPPAATPATAPPQPAQQAEGSSLFQGRSAKITTDESNNSLLITATRQDYERITKILTRLDVQPTQVMLEALIAEVTLNDDLKFGVKWSQADRHSFKFTDSAVGAVAASFPGFSYFFQSNNFASAIDALQAITKVKVMSAPSLMVLDNRKATLQIGDQVPIVSQSTANPLVGNGTVINSITQRDTGIILNVAPRVSDSGRVTLEIEQEVSNVARTTSSGIDSPTFQQRRIKTTVVVSDGEVIALGGLIQERDTITKSQIPLLGEIPVLGAAFRQKSDKIDRTELIVFLRPTVVRDAAEARDVTEEFRHRLQIGTPTTLKGRDKFDRDAQRIFR